MIKVNVEIPDHVDSICVRKTSYGNIQLEAECVDDGLIRRSTRELTLDSMDQYNAVDPIKLEFGYCFERLKT